MVEEAINKTNFKDKVGIGISMMADNLYIPDQKKYELENPKLLLDTDAMVFPPLPSPPFPCPCLSPHYYFKLLD